MSTYAYDQLVRAFRKARRNIDAAERLHGTPTATMNQQHGADEVAECLAEILADDDPKFDPEAFRRAVWA